MSAKDGKEFEDLFSKILEKTGCDCIRFYDTTLGYQNIDNPADFVISKDPELPSILVELKHCEKSSWKTDFRQLNRLLELKNFKSYVIVWFREYQKVLAFKITDIKFLVDKGVKSINPSRLEGIPYLDLCSEFKRIKPAVINYNKLWENNY